jgi:hypothetical protein
MGRFYEMDGRGWYWRVFSIPWRGRGPIPQPRLLTEWIGRLAANLSPERANKALTPAQAPAAFIVGHSMRFKDR